MSNRRRSKRKIKIPLKSGDTVCDLVGSKNNSENVEFCDLAKEIGDSNGDDGEYIRDVNGTEEIDVSEMMNDFPTIAESLNRTDTVSHDESNTSTPVRVEIVNHCTPVNGSTEHVIDCTQTNCKNTIEKSDCAKDDVVLKSFVNTVCENVVDNKLILIHTGTNDGREVVVFDDEILKDGVKKWQMTLCGHFVGYRMKYAELKYNLSRMWGKHRLSDIVTQNDMFLFKFRNEEGMNQVLENRPWMVNNKPLFIQKWNTGVIMDNKEPKVIPLWVKLYSVPIEAWTVNGISAIASSLGKPLIMDKTTTRICNEGKGRIGYARVLVEMQAEKEFKEKIEICYRSSDNQGKGFSKFVEVEYSWKPPVCGKCKVFGHSENKCGKTHENISVGNGVRGPGFNGNGIVRNNFRGAKQIRNESKSVKNKEGNKEDCVEHHVKGFGKNIRQTRFEFRPVNKGGVKEASKGDTQNSGNNDRVESRGKNTSWRINEDNMKELKKSANKFSTLEDLGDTELNKGFRPNDIEIVDKYVKYLRQPTLEESKDWTNEMFKYFKDQWEMKCKDGYLDEEDVCEEDYGLASIITKNVVNGKNAWNVRGMCNKETQKEVKRFICDERLSVCATLETHIKPKQIDRISSKVFGRWSWFSNINESIRGCRIIVAWNPEDVSITQVHCSKQSILCTIETITSKIKFFCCFTYAANTRRERKDLWKDLYRYKRIVNDNPWILMGDWNVSLNIEDHSEGGSCKTTDMTDFQECIEKIEIEDVKSCGNHFTWIKSRQNPDNSILKKIDRIMANDNFIGKFSNSTAHFLPHLSSDHCLVVLIMPNTLNKRRRAFRFANFVANKPEFNGTVDREWNIQTTGCKMFKLVKKLKAIKFHMKNLSWKNGNLFERVEIWKEKLKVIQCQIDKDPHNASLRVEEANILKEYNIAMKEEEQFLFQKAKITWMSDGDKNSKFFHAVIKGRIHRNRIDVVCDEKNVTFEGLEVAEQFVKHFQSFLGKSSNVEPIIPNTLNVKKVSVEDATFMIRQVTDKEIKEALFDICDNKAPGPDGFTSKFYKKAWNTVGKNVCDAIKEFFRKGKMLGEVNATLITLVPKLQTPKKVLDYRPIACCNVLYKIISKILTNRIKTALCKIVSPTQSAFIPGRQITDNILLTQELLRGYTWKNGPKRVAMKIDIQKAYDTVNWDFLECTLKEFEFPQKMVEWIMVCVRSASFSICVNGERHGYFKGGRGLRQGDPISPYIFTLVMEVFTKIMQKKISESNDFKYHWGCKELKISHLCFADDLLVLCHGDLKSVEVVKSALDYFSSVSGLLPNLGKSTVFFSNIDDNTKEEVLNLLPFKIGKLPVSYLGVPLITKQLGVKECKNLIDKVKVRVNNWKNKLLSYVGRLQLVASVLASMQIYWASVFILPKAVVKEIDRLLKGFLWCQGNISKGKAKVAWKLVCRPKKEGGLGIKNLSIWNEVLMAKHLWNIACNKESLWVKWINELRSKMRSYIKTEVGNGESIFLWHDRWWKEGVLTDLISTESLNEAESNTKLSEMIDNRKWKWPMMWTRRYPILNSIPVPKLENCQYKTVLENNEGVEIKFSISAMWNNWVQNEETVAWYKVVWFSQCNPKHSFILWLTILKRLTTQDRIIKWYPGKHVSCPLCDERLDSHEHLFFECSYSMEIWNTLKKKVSMEDVNNEWNYILQRVTEMACNNSIKSILRRIVLAACVYYIWDEKNKRLFGNQKRDYKTLIMMIVDNIRLKLMSLKVKNSNHVMTISKEWQLDGIVSLSNSSSCSDDSNGNVAHGCVDLNENKSFSLVLVMPSARASMV
ncbi:RNA-directed DNA polymerase, eukaryota, reverse transcriptase zinc-binding domain protein [Tanacetum coccineum]